MNLKKAASVIKQSGELFYNELVRRRVPKGSAFGSSSGQDAHRAAVSSYPHQSKQSSLCSVFYHFSFAFNESFFYLILLARR
ncbi:MAG: hypothetical protein IKW06_01595 [Clostridia bacterium]|nr:hypothetical protein [Clostridia bacterium]